MNEIHAITTCFVCQCPLGLTYKICEVCVDYYFCWDCYLNNAVTSNHELTHPVLTVPFNYLDNSFLYHQPLYFEQSNNSDEDEQEEMDIHNDDDLDNQDIAEPPAIPIVPIESVDGPSNSEDEVEEPKDINTPPCVYSSPEVLLSTSASSSSTEDDSIVEEFIDTLFELDHI